MAAINSKSKSVLTYAICYGFAGGRLHSGHFHRLMREASFRPASKAEADILIAHSAGCWQVPTENRAKLLLYAGMPLANARPLETWRKVLIAGARRNPLKRTILLMSRNLAHSLLQPKRNLHIMRHAAHLRPIVLPDVPTIFIANKYDLWPQAPSLRDYIDTQDWTFISLPGGHNEIWDKPENFVTILKHYADILA